MHRFIRTPVTVATLSLVLVLGLGGAAGAQVTTSVPFGGTVDATAVQNSPGGASTPTAPVRGLGPGEEADDGDDGSSVLPWVLAGVVLLVVAGGAVAMTRRRAAESGPADRTGARRG